MPISRISLFISVSILLQKMSSFQKKIYEAGKKATKNITLQRDKANHRTRLRHDTDVGTFKESKITMINIINTLIEKEDSV